MAIKIERLHPRDGITEKPLETPHGYKLADPRHGDQKKLGENAIYRRHLTEVVKLLREGFSIWMHRAGKRPSLICPESLKITDV